jgi:ClpA/ClpB-like protein
MSWCKRDTTSTGLASVPNMCSGWPKKRHIKSATEFLHTHKQLRESGDVDGFTTDGKHALELAISEAGQLGQTSLGTEHLLLGLLQGTGMAAGVLMIYRLKLDNARTETRRLLSL